MRAIIKNNERKYDIKHYLARNRSTHSVGHCRSVQSFAVNRAAYVSSSDWSVHRPRRLGRWGVYSTAVRLKFFTAWRGSASRAYGKPGRVWLGDDVKNLARHEMKQFLIEQIPVLFFLAIFFMMLALGG